MDSRTGIGPENGRARTGNGGRTEGRSIRLGPIVPPRPEMRRWQRAVATILGVPLFYKILLANAVIVAAVAIAGPIVTIRLLDSPQEIETAKLAGLTLAAVLSSILINALILRLALSPLRRLEETAARVQAGDLDARAELSPVADRDLERLVVTFNGMLDSGAAYRERLREIAARALDAAEEERKRIARELHDGIAQSLAALRVRLRLARTAKEPTVREDHLEAVSAAIGEATEEVRRIARGLRPPALDMLGLAPAIESHARNLAEVTGIAVDIDLAPVGNLITPEAELALYRVLQEALSNVVRHADAGRVRVRLKRRAGFIEAVVEDDGRGFTVDEVMRDGAHGLGLFGMQERASYVGGRVEITSKPGHGTRVRVTIPKAETESYV